VTQTTQFIVSRGQLVIFMVVFLEQAALRFTEAGSSHRFQYAQFQNLVKQSRFETSWSEARGWIAFVYFVKFANFRTVGSLRLAFTRQKQAFLGETHLSSDVPLWHGPSNQHPDREALAGAKNLKKKDAIKQYAKNSN
jgi:hypothetical protein